MEESKKPYKLYFIDGEYKDTRFIGKGRALPNYLEFKGSTDIFHNTGKFNEKENAMEYSCDPKWPELAMEIPESPQ